MLQSELKKLQELAGALGPQEGTSVAPSSGLLQIRMDIAAECDRVREALTRAVFTQSKDNLVERYIQFHQTGLIALADQLQGYLVEGALPEAQVTSGIFITRLCGLLDYIEKYFSRYFDLNAPVPDSYRLISLKQLGDTINRLRAAIERKSPSPLLAACLENYLGAFGQEADKPSFRDLVYLKAFLAETAQVFSLPEDQYTEELVRQKLIYLNFNHLGFLVACQAQVRAELEPTDTREQQLAVLSHALGLVKSLQGKPGFSYSPSWPSIKTMLETWLSDEISLIHASREKGPVPLSAGAETSEKMILNLSVAHIACLTRLLMEENYYGSASVTDVLKFTVRHYRSKRKEHISAGSISKEYYGVTQVTAAWVRDLLLRMTARLNKMYFPVWAVAGAIIAGCS